VAGDLHHFVLDSTGVAMITSGTLTAAACSPLSIAPIRSAPPGALSCLTICRPEGLPSLEQARSTADEAQPDDRVRFARLLATTLV
jgi:hypothetical protein